MIWFEEQLVEMQFNRNHERFFTAEFHAQYLLIDPASHEL
jgi:hypothetical protein